MAVGEEEVGGEDEVEEPVVPEHHPQSLADRAVNLDVFHPLHHFVKRLALHNHTATQPWGGLAC